MKKFPYLIMLAVILTACSDGGTPTCVGPYGSCDFGNLTPDKDRFTDAAANSNKKVSMMIATNDAQINKYIGHKLRGYSAASTLDYADVAQTALNIASGGNFADADDETRRAAMYVVSPELLDACGGATNVMSCVDDWRANNAELLKNRLTDLRAHADKLDISDIDFTTAAGTDKTLKFSVDANGKITGVTVDDTEYARSGDGTVFTNGNSTLKYTSGATNSDGILDPKLGLSYADFGVYQITTDGVSGPQIAFAGGYDTKRIGETVVQQNIETDIKFSGAAVGTVTNGGGKQIGIRDDSTTLTFAKDSGQSTLAAGFDNWYNITVTKDMNDTTANIVFSDYRGTDDFKLPTDTVSGTADMNMGYYGANPATGIPTEAAGLIRYENGDINMDVAFGVKR